MVFEKRSVNSTEGRNPQRFELHKALMRQL